jgi:hypothetical protein
MLLNYQNIKKNKFLLGFVLSSVLDIDMAVAIAIDIEMNYNINIL